MNNFAQNRKKTCMRYPRNVWLSMRRFCFRIFPRVAGATEELSLLNSGWWVHLINFFTCPNAIGPFYRHHGTYVISLEKKQWMTMYILHVLWLQTHIDTFTEGRPTKLVILQIWDQTLYVFGTQCPLFEVVNSYSKTNDCLPTRSLTWHHWSFV